MYVIVYYTKHGRSYDVRATNLANGSAKYLIYFSVVDIEFDNQDDIIRMVRGDLARLGLNPYIPIIFRPWTKRGED